MAHKETRFSRALTTMFNLENITSMNNNPNYKNAMIGNFFNCPSINTKIIKVFLSSTFSDMTAERNAIMKHVYPKLKKFCREKYGIEFQILDMRWGVPSDSELDHQGPELCYQEIINCQNSSCSLNFIAIIGHRYGSVNPPFKIIKDHFAKIVNILESVDISTETLREWYEEDKNNLPHIYTLKPIQTESAEINLDKIRECRKKWSHIEQEISENLSYAANILLDQGELTRTEMKRFNSSVTEQEIEIGICNAKVIENQKLDSVAAFIREIPDIDKYIHDPKANKYIDIKSKPDNIKNQVKDQAFEFIDDTMNKIMTDLIEISIKKNVEESRICEIRVQWNELFRKTDNRYLTEFKEKFYEKVTNIINNNMTNMNSDYEDELYNETLQHSLACIHHVKHFQGRVELLSKVKEYLLGSSNLPLIVYGESGSGKTSILAKAAFMARDFLKEDERANAIILLRFLGTTLGTSSIRNTMKYLCRQLIYFTGEETEVAKIDNYKEIVQKFYSTLKRLAEFRKIVIFIDSIDQLQRSDGAYTLSWLVTPLHPNVKMVLSTLPQHEDILLNLQLKYEDPSCYLEVTQLNENLCINILMSLLKDSNRTLTTEQNGILQQAFGRCSLPIYVHLIYRTAVNWRSHFSEDVCEQSLRYTVREAIFQLFGNMEKKHNKTLVRHSLGFITASRNGLSESELEDIMSLDDRLLQKVFIFHLPPQIRIPPFLWSRLRNDIGSYLVEREADNSRVLYWYHRQFIEVAHEYFLSDQEFKTYIHDTMADFFLGTYSNMRTKRFYYPDYITKKLQLPPYSDEDRGVISQPNIFPSENKLQQIYNLRKISELPWHLAHSGRHAEFADHIAFNYEFLLNKLKTSSRSNLLEDLVLVRDSETSYKMSMTVLYNAIRMSTLSLATNPNNLAFDLIGRLSDFVERPEHARLRDLFKQIYHQSHQHIGYLPVGQCLDSGSDLVHLTLDTDLGMGLVLPNNVIAVFSMMEKKISYYDCDGNIVKVVETETNLFMTMKFMITREIKSDFNIISVLNITTYDNQNSVEEEQNDEMTVTRDLDKDENEQDKKQQRIIAKVNLLTGKYTTINVFSKESLRFKDDNLFDLNEDYTQVDSRTGHAALLRNKDFDVIYEYNEDTVHTCLSRFDNYNCIIYKVSDTYHLKIVDLSNNELQYDFGLISTYIKPITCYFIALDILLIGFYKQSSSEFILYKYRIDQDALVAFDKVLVGFMHSLPVRLREYWKSSNNLLVITAQHDEDIKLKRTSHGYIYHLKNETLITLYLDKEDADCRKYTKTLGESAQIAVSDDEKLVFSTGEKCLIMCWNAETGTLIKVLKLGVAESILCGVLTGQNKIAICHFCDDTGKTTDERLFILLKIFNTEEFSKPDIHKVEQRQSYYPIEFTKHLTNPTTSILYNECSCDELDGLFLIKHSEQKMNFLTDGIVNQTIRLTDEDLYITINILEIQNDKVLFNANFTSISSKSVFSINLSESVKEQKIDILFEDCLIDNSLYLRNNIARKFFNYESTNYLFDNILNGYLISLKVKSKTLIGKSLNIQTNDITQFESKLSYSTYLKFFAIIQLKNKPDNFLIAFITEKIHTLENFKKERDEIKWTGEIFYMKLLETNGSFEMTLDSYSSDIGSNIALIDDEFLINYKMEVFQSNNGNKCEDVWQIDKEYFYLSPIVCNNGKYILSQKLTKPYSVTFELGLGDGESDDSELMAILPLRQLSLFDINEKKLIAEYPYENEIDIYYVFRNGLNFCQFTHSEIARFQVLNQSKTYEKNLVTKKSVKNPKFSDNFEELKMILTKLLKEVVDKRPMDPIRFIASELRLIS